MGDVNFTPEQTFQTKAELEMSSILHTRGCGGNVVDGD
jgi:hypothetical protein